MNLTKKIENLEKSAIKLTVTVSKEDVKSIYQDTLKKYLKNAQIPGFRRGHVPQNILEKKYGEGIKADALSEIVDSSIKEILDNEDATDIRPLPYSQPKMDTLPSFDVENELTYDVTYDVFPKITVSNFSGINIKETQVEITEKDLEEELKNIQERNAIVIDKNEDAVVEKENIVTINYSELDDSNNVIDGTSREDFVFTVGSGYNYFKIDDDIIGMKKNEERDITKTYAKDEKDADLAGTTKKIRVKVTAIKIKNLPPLDDDLAQDVNEKYQTLQDLKDAIKKNMEVARDRRLRELKNNALLEQLVEKNNFDLPESMLNAEVDSRWQQMASQFQTTPDALEKLLTSTGDSKDNIISELTKASEKALKSNIIIDALFKERNITITDEEIEKAYEKIAEENNVTVDEIKNLYSDPRTKKYFIDETKEQKLFDELYKEVKFSKGDKKAFAELFQQQ